MHHYSSRLRRYGVLAITGLAFLTTIVPASASVRGRKTTAAVLAGVAAYHLVKGHTTTGLIAGAGAAYAWKRAGDAQKAANRRAAARRCRVRSSRRHRVSTRRHHYRRYARR